MIKKLLIALTALVLVLSMNGCKKDKASAGGKKVLKIWHYESENGAMGKAWAAAMQEFSRRHPDVKIEFELKGFEQIRQTAQMVLNSNEAPDVMEYNKGNATAGMLAKQGLLTDLTAVAREKKWDSLLSPSLQTTCRYSKEGIMGSGNWYGVTNYGEYVMVYYNKEMFAEHNLKVPQTIKEFETVMDTFKNAGIIPLTIGAAEYPAQQVFYQLVLNRADRDFVNGYQLYTKDIDFKNNALMFGANKTKEWFDKGYIDKTRSASKQKTWDLLLQMERARSLFQAAGGTAGL